MKKYICLNHGECNWADEKPPRDFTLPEIDENACPNCGSGNIKEKPTASGPPWPKITGVVGLLLLIAAIVWFSWPSPPPPLVLTADLNCQTGLMTLTATGGDEDPIIFGQKGSNETQNSNVFKIPKSQFSGSTLTFYAVQNGDTANVHYNTACKQFPPPPRPRGDSKPPFVAVKWTQVAGSEFCVGDCIVAYSEIDNLGHTRERRVENYEKCCPADK